MARPRAADYDEQRTLLMRAAAALFAQRGYTAATMSDVAAASGVSKATLYHYFSDKHALLGEIVGSHVARLQGLARDVMPAVVPQAVRGANDAGPAFEASGRRPVPATAADERRLRELIQRFMLAYADAQNEHRVLTEDVKFLDDAARQTVLDGQREVVAAFARGIAACRPDLDAAMAKPLAMLLFGMINWTFTWLRPDGVLTHDALAQTVADLFFGGLGQVREAVPAPPPSVRPDRPPASDQAIDRTRP
jgi:AcrR family transcriptional regulator